MTTLLILTLAAQSLDPLSTEFERLARLPSGTIGATAVHVETGRRASFNGQEYFPMASAFKVPIAIHLLARVDEGKEKLDRMITLQPTDYHPGSGTLTPLFNPPGAETPGVALAMRNLLELMLRISDNSATDILLREVGGPDAVNDRLKALDIKGIIMSGPTKTMIENWRADKVAFNKDNRDSSTPDGMALLLHRLALGKTLSGANTGLLLDVLRRCDTGDNRLKGILPAGTIVMHKTGSIGGTTNDVGIIRLPGDAGHVAIAVFVKGSDAPVAQRERVIAELARAAHDYFLFVKAR
ncbi:MAG: class A beta-lactamase [Bryobacteraceae bacterium]|nr:class A beta-lactamase [Bryobacteraceae bacterium]